MFKRIFALSVLIVVFVITISATPVSAQAQQINCQKFVVLEVSGSNYGFTIAAWNLDFGSLGVRDYIGAPFGSWEKIWDYRIGLREVRFGGDRWLLLWLVARPEAGEPITAAEMCASQYLAQGPNALILRIK